MTELNTTQVDNRSEELIEEFHQHIQKCRAHAPQLDERTIFEGWVIQKLAGIQTIVLSLAEDLSRLRTLLLDPSLLNIAQEVQKGQPKGE
jgi:hypothetical protein